MAENTEQYIDLSTLGSQPLELAFPDDDQRETMIEVEHVSMIFNMASEQLNSLKEYAISLARRELRFKEFRALDDVSLTVKRGDVYGIMGTNGSGKSTLLKIIAGVLEPSKGTCAINGTIAPLIELGAGFDIELTARENIYLNGALLGYSKEFINEHFDEIVAFAEVGPFLDMPLKNYSSGMVARVAFAIATVIVPDILIVDEVLSVGDFMFQQKCERRIQSLIRDHGVTVLIVSHNSDQIERLCNKAIWIEKGHTRMIGPASDVCRLYRVLGGRKGSSESERIILDLFEKTTEATSKNEGISALDKITSPSSYGLSTQLFLRDEAHRESLVIATGKDPTTAILAAVLASAMDADIIAVGEEELEAPLMQALHERDYRRAIVMQSEGRSSRSLKAQLAEHLTKASIEEVKGDMPSWLSRAVHTLAEEDGFEWANTAALCAPHNKSDLVAISSYLLENKIPLFFIDEAGSIPDQVLERINTFESLILLGGDVSFPKASLAGIDPRIEIERLFGNGPYDAYLKIREWTEARSSQNTDERRACFVSSLTDVEALTTAGLFANRNNGSLLFYSDQDADSIAAVIQKIRTRSAQGEDTCFIGIASSMNSDTIALFSQASSLS